MKLKNVKMLLTVALCAVGLSAFAAKDAAKLTNGATTTYYAEEELYQLLVVDGLKDGDKLEFLTDVDVQDDFYNDYYSFTAGSTINAMVGKDGTSWDIDIAGQNAGIVDSVGTTAGFSKNYEFNDEGAYVQLYASSIAGAFVAPVVEVHEEIEVTGVVKVEDLTFEMMESITLKGKGCVYTKDSKLKEYIKDEDGNEIEAKDASSILGEGWYVYALDDDPDFYVSVRIIDNPVKTYYYPEKLVDVAYCDVQRYRAEGKTLEVKGLMDKGLEYATSDWKFKIEKDVRIVVQDMGYGFGGALNFAGKISGLVTALDLAKIDDANIVLGPDAKVFVSDTVTLTTDFFTPTKGYEVVLDTESQPGYKCFKLVERQPVKVDALSNVLVLDLTAGDRIAQDEETLVVDPAWGPAETATVKLQNGWVRTYNCASNDLWDTTALEPGRHGLAFRAGETAVIYGAFFWKTGADWTVFDSSNITADVTFEPGKTYLFFGTNTVDATLTVTDGAKLLYDERAPAGFLGGTVAELPKRYEQKTVEGDLYQIVEKIKGCEDNPWEVGGTDETDDLVTAWTNGNELVIGGTGAVTNLADVAKEIRDGIKAITITKPTVTGAAEDAFLGLGGGSEVKVSLPDGWQGELPDKDGKLYGMKVDMTNFTYPTAVKNVEFLQRYPWNGLVDITCDLSGEGAVKLTVAVLTNGVTLVAKPTITGETTVDLDAAGGAMEGVRLIWNAAKDLPAGFKAQNVKVKVMVEKAPSPEPVPAGQLWANGPIWAETNFGTSEVQGHPEYGALFKFEDAVNAVAQIKDGSRLPTKEEFEKLIDTSVCDQAWDGTRKGYLFTGKGDYAANSIFVPAAGFDTGSGVRMSAERTGICWSSTLDPTDDGCAFVLDFSDDNLKVHSDYECSLGLSVRTVKDAAK